MITRPNRKNVSLSNNYEQLITPTKAKMEPTTFDLSLKSHENPLQTRLWSELRACHYSKTEDTALLLGHIPQSIIHTY